MKLNQLHPETVSLALLDLGQERSLSRGTMRTIHKVLKTCLNQGVRWRILSPAEADIGPCPLPDQERETIQALDTDQITQLIDALRGDQYEVLFLTALLSGLRTEELFGLTWNNLRGEVIEVRQALQYHDGHPVIVNQLKTVKARRDVSIPAQLAGRLLEYQRTREEELRRRAPTKWDQMGLIFLSRDGTPLRHSNVRRRLQRILARAGLPMISTYGLRHSYATASLILGVDRHVVMESMGHSTPVMTMRYETVVQKLRDDAARALDRAFDLDPP